MWEQATSVHCADRPLYSLASVQNSEHIQVQPVPFIMMLLAPVKPSQYVQVVL